MLKTLKIISCYFKGKGNTKEMCIFFTPNENNGSQFLVQLVSMHYYHTLNIMWVKNDSADGQETQWLSSQLLASDEFAF